MNDKVIEFALESGIAYKVGSRYWIDAGEVDIHLERFADLVRQDETKSCAEHYLAIMRDSVKQAVLKEREACAKLCEDQIKSYMSKRYTTDPLGGYRERFASEQCAKAIRARKETT